MTTMTDTKTTDATIERATCLKCGEREAIRASDGRIACPVCEHGEFERVLCNVPDPRQPIREEIAADDIRTIADGTYWAVLDLRGRIREDGQIPDPEILFSGLESREAADLARREAIACLLDNGTPYGTSEGPCHFYDVAGRMLRYLRGRNVADAEAIACDMAHAEPWDSYARSGAPGPDLPF